MAGRPWFKFFVGDWHKDPELRRCSKSTKGVWIDMICLAYECEEIGVFQTSGVPWSDSDIAVAVGGDTAENLRAIEELLTKGVCSRNNAGAIFCRRVVREEAKARACSIAGMKGGNPALKRQVKGVVKGQVKGGLKQTSDTDIDPESNTSPLEPIPRSNTELHPPPPTRKGGITFLMDQVQPVTGPLACDAFRSAWADWLSYLVRKGQTVDMDTAKGQLELCATMGLDRSLAAFKARKTSGHASLFEDRSTKKSTQASKGVFSGNEQF
jgi:hypothetical protein